MKENYRWRLLQAALVLQESESGAEEEEEEK